MYTQDSISQLVRGSRQAKKKYNILQGYITKHHRKNRPSAIDATNARAEFKTEINNLLRLLNEIGMIKSPAIINHDHLTKELNSYISELLSKVAFPNELNSLNNIMNLIKEGGFTRVFGIILIRTTNLQVRFCALPHVHQNLRDIEPDQVKSLHKDLVVFGKDLNDLIFNIQATIKILNYSHKEDLVTKVSIRNNLSKAA